MDGPYISHVQQDRQRMYKSNIEARSHNHCCHGKEISITYSEWVFVAFVTHNAKGMRRVILSSVAYLYLQYISGIFEKKYVIGPKTCVSTFV
jgi:hypothetical protein